MAADFSELIYGTAQNVASKTGSGLTESLKAGADLAMEAEKLQQTKATLMQQKQTLESAKFDKVAGWFNTLANMPEGGPKKAFAKDFIPRGINGLGLTEAFDPTVLQMLQSDPTLATFIRTEIANNRMSIADLQDPDKVAQQVNAAGQFGDRESFRQQLGETVVASGKDFAEAEKEALGRQNAVRAAEAQAGKQDDKLDKDFRDYAKDLNKEARTRFKDIVDTRAALRGAEAGINTIEADFKAGRKLNPNLASAISRGVAKAYNSGAMTDADVADFQKRPGFEGFTEAAVNKWLTGNVDINLVRNLKAVVKNSQATLGAKAQEVEEGLDPIFAAYPDRREELRRLSGVDAYVNGKTAPKEGLGPSSQQKAPSQNPGMDAAGKALQSGLTKARVALSPERVATIKAQAGNNLSQIRAWAKKLGITTDELADQLEGVK